MRFQNTVILEGSVTRVIHESDKVIIFSLCTSEFTYQTDKNSFKIRPMHHRCSINYACKDFDFFSKNLSIIIPNKKRKDVNVKLLGQLFYTNTFRNFKIPQSAWTPDFQKIINDACFSTIKTLEFSVLDYQDFLPTDGNCNADENDFENCEDDEMDDGQKKFIK